MRRCCGRSSHAWAKQRAASANAGAQFNALRARLQAADWTLNAGYDGDFTVSRWGQSRHLADVAALERFARQVGVKL